MSETHSALKAPSEPPPSEGPVSGNSPAAAAEPVDEASHNDASVDPDAGVAVSDGDGEDSAPVAEGSRDWDAERLSAVEADALAESFRPAWETDWGSASVSNAVSNVAVDHESMQSPVSKDFGTPAAPLVVRAQPMAPGRLDTARGDETGSVRAVLPGADTAKRNLLLSGAAFVLAVGVIMAFMMSGGDEPGEAAAASAAPTGSVDPALAEEAADQVAAGSALEDSPEEEDALAAGGPAADPAPTGPVTHQLTIRTVPREATLTLDGERVSNPLRQEVEADDAVHRVVATADGYQEASESIRFDGDREHVVELEPVPAPEPAPRAQRPTPPPTTSRRRTAQPAGMRSAMQSTAMRSAMRGAGFTSTNPY